MEVFFLSIDHLFLVVDRLLVDSFKDAGDEFLTQTSFTSLCLHGLQNFKPTLVL